jgi:phosphoglycolate phosphatase-like HAD superfamily hydrolase
MLVSLSGVPVLPRTGEDVHWAEEIAFVALAEPLPRRWRHSQGVAARAADVRRLVEPGWVLHAAAWLHDVGYAPDIAITGFHPLDGARWLAARGVDERVVRLVAHHSCADIEAEERGLAGELAAFPFDDPSLVEALIFCDMTTSPDGEVVTVDERINEILDRYGSESLVGRSVARAAPELRRAVRQISGEHSSGLWADDHVAPLLVLWDVDHTLIANDGVSKLVYASAFRTLSGRSPQFVARTEGRTDPEILADLFERHGLSFTAEVASALQPALVDAMAEHVSELAERGSSLPGAREALLALHQTPGVVQSVLSGNIRANAETKLRAFGLDSYLDFEVGGYGSDDTVRSNLVGIAQRRAGAKYAHAFTHDTTVLIGDTPRDVQAGEDGGSRVIAVATGIDSADVLSAAGADVVLSSLSDTDEVFSALGVSRHADTSP